MMNEWMENGNTMSLAAILVIPKSYNRFSNENIFFNDGDDWSWLSGSMISHQF